MKKVLVVHAVKEEFVPIRIKDCEIKYILTGIGKTKSAMKLTKAICNEKPDLVLNLGTAGTLNHIVGDIFVCQKFVDRDFLNTDIPGVESEIDFEKELSDVDFVQNWLTTKTEGICNTGDSFVSQAEEFVGDIVEMEGFAHAIVCKEFNVPLVAVKYVTDLIGQNSIKHWEDKLADARKGLADWFDGK